MEPYDSVVHTKEQEHVERVYNAYILKQMPKTKLVKGCFRAFWVGGTICAIGQGFILIGSSALGMELTDARGFASICIIIITALLTGIGVFDKIGQYAGAGSTVPISGFANGIVAPAMEHKREGLLLGVGANLFKIAGPVLVNGISASVIYGIIYYLFLR